MHNTLSGQKRHPIRRRMALGGAAARPAWLMIGLLACGAALAQRADNVAPNMAATSAGSTRVSFPLGFGAEWDDALHARDRARVTALMRRARGQMPVDKFGETPLHRLPGLHQFADVVPVMTALLSSGADVQAGTARGYTPLHMAAASACTVCVPVLLRAGARVQAANRDGTTPLHMSHPNTRAALLAAGADIAARDQLGRVPLHTANPPGDELMGPGVGVNVVDAQGFTPLHWAAFSGRHPDIEWLLARGANPTLRSTAPYAYTDGILAAEWATTETYPAGQRPFDLARARHDATKWSSGQFRRAWEVLDKATPRQGLFSR